MFEYFHDIIRVHTTLNGFINGSKSNSEITSLCITNP